MSLPVATSLVYLSRTRHRGYSRACDVVQDLVEGVKLEEPRALAVAARLMSYAAKGSRAVLVPVPRSTPGRASIELAKALLREGVGSRVVPAVVRVGSVPSSRLARRAGRATPTEADHVASMRYAGGLRPFDEVLLVDDVLTTGTTLRAVAQVLRVGGHRGRIRAVVVAAAPATQPVPCDTAPRTVTV